MGCTVGHVRCGTGSFCRCGTVGEKGEIDGLVAKRNISKSEVSIMIYINKQKLRKLVRVLGHRRGRLITTVAVRVTVTVFKLLQQY